MLKLVYEEPLYIQPYHGPVPVKLTEITAVLPEQMVCVPDIDAVGADTTDMTMALEVELPQMFVIVQV